MVDEATVQQTDRHAPLMNHYGEPIIRVKIHHRHHWEWTPPTADEPARVDEDLIPLHPDYPELVLVKRLQDRHDGYTEVEIPVESINRMTNELAQKEGSDSPSHRHRRMALQRHINDIVHEHHSPIEHWHDIEVEGEQDDGLVNHLKTVFLEGQA